MSIRWDLRRPPTQSWTSLIGSSPGHMQPGRQSHINQKSKEALFYEHLPVPTSYRLIFYWRKFATEPGIRDAFVAVLQFSLNFLCSKYTDWCFNVHQVRTRSTPFIGKKGNICFLKHAPANSKKAKRHPSNS